MTLLCATGDCVAPETCTCEQNGVMYNEGDAVIVDDCYLWYVPKLYILNMSDVIKSSFFLVPVPVTRRK